jgi:hypothetical protein
MTQIITFSNSDIDGLEGHINQWLQENNPLVLDTHFAVNEAEHLTYPEFIYVIRYTEVAR